VTLHRAIIRFDTSHTDENLRSITRAAAKMRFTSAIDLVNRLEPAHLQSFWYFASKVNLAIIGTFGSLLWATSQSVEEAEFYKSQLAEYRWTLRVSSKAAEFMKFTVGLLDTSTVFVKDANSKNGTPKVGKLETEDSRSDQVPLAPEVDMNLHAHEPVNNMGMNEVSPSVDYSTESLGAYEQDIESSANQMAQENLPQWSDFSNHVNFTSGDIQDWGLDQLYNFETIPNINPAIPGRPFVQEYDERGNHFAGF
jgi:hypothetical protein